MRPARSGFTLVELMVVLIIIGMLIGLVTPAVMLALRKSRNAAIKAEIDMLHMAIMNYRNEYGSFPPCYSQGYAVGTAAVKHLTRLFPRCAVPAGQFSGASALVPATALVSWMNGYSTDPTLPLTGAGGRKRLYDFDQTRIASVGSNRVVYFPSGNLQSPYIYISREQYGQSWPPVSPPDTFGYNDGVTSVVIPSGQYFAEPLRTKAGVVPGEFFNHDTFQILCAGRDGKWNTEDDLSNFWPGTRKEYLDSLQP